MPTMQTVISYHFNIYTNTVLVKLHNKEAEITTNIVLQDTRKRERQTCSNFKWRGIHGSNLLQNGSQKM